MSGIYKKGEMKPYPARQCPHCTKYIPKLTRSGNPIRASKYLDLKTCGGLMCMRNEKGWIKPMTSPITGTAMDRFLYGGAQ